MQFLFRFIKEAVVWRCSVEKVFIDILQNSQENTCARVSFLTKLQALGLRPATLLRKRLWHGCFPVSFAKFLRTPFFTGHIGWLLLLLVFPFQDYFQKTFSVFMDMFFVYFKYKFMNK